MATKSLNRVHVDTATVGTGTVTLGSGTAANTLTFAQAGASDGDVVNYVIEEGADFEIGLGTIGGGGTTLSRDTVKVSKIGASVSTAKMTLAGAAKVRSAETADFFNHMFPAGEEIKTGAYTIVADDLNKTIVANSASALTFALTAAATLGVFAVMIKNIGAGALTIDPDAAETIDGAASVVIRQGQSLLVVCNGTAFRTLLWARANLSELDDVDFETDPPTTGDGMTFNGTKWVPGPAGGGMFKGDNGTVGSRSGDIFRINNAILTADTTIDADENASCAGPLEIDTGVTLTVNGTLVIV